jgi:hypothetical protein
VGGRIIRLRLRSSELGPLRYRICSIAGLQEEPLQRDYKLVSNGRFPSVEWALSYASIYCGAVSILDLVNDCIERAPVEAMLGLWRWSFYFTGSLAVGSTPIILLRLEPHLTVQS